MMQILSKPSNNAKGYLFRDEDGRVIGYACLAFKGGKEFHYNIKNCDAFLFDFAALEQYRGQGWGRKILDSLVSSLKKGTLCLAVKTDNEAAINLYKKYGFKLVKETKFIRMFKLDIPSLSV